MGGAEATWAPLTPLDRGNFAPVAVTGVALDHVDHDLLLQVYEAGRVDRRVVAVGAQKRGLVDPEMRDGSDAAGIINQGRAVLDHRVHHRPPAHAHLLRDARHWPGVLADLAARLRARPAGEHDLRVDVIRALGPGLRRAVPIRAAPPALAPHEGRRTTEAGQISDRDRHPLMRDRPSPARAADRHHRGRLDRDDQLIGPLAHLEHPEPVKSQQLLRQASTVAHAGGLLIVAAFRQL